MYKKTVVNEKLRIITENIPQMPSVTIGIWVKTGSQDEVPEIAGMSHMLEHLMFKGTERRSAKKISEELDNVGGHLNAFTSREYTCYYAKVLTSHTELAVDVLMDMLFHSAFPEDEIEKEKNVILEEIRMYDDTPDEIIHDLLTQSYWPDHPLGRPVLGSADAVSAMSRQNVIDYFSENYCNENVVIVAAGKLNHDSFVTSVTNRLGKLKTNMPDRTFANLVAVPTLKIRNKKTEQAHICIGCQGVSRTSKDYYTMMILTSILGGSSSSRLFQSIREEKGLAYSVYSYNNSYQNTGITAIYTGTGYHNIADVLNIISDEMKKISDQIVGEDELNRAKEQLKGNMLMSLESSTSRMNRIGKSELFFDRVIPVNEIVRKIDRVTAEQVVDLARRTFVKDKLALTMIGKVDENKIEKYYQKLLK